MPPPAPCDRQGDNAVIESPCVPRLWMSVCPELPGNRGTRGDGSAQHGSWEAVAGGLSAANWGLW